MTTITIRGRQYAMPTRLDDGSGLGSVYVRRADGTTGHYEKFEVVARAVRAARAEGGWYGVAYDRRGRPVVCFVPR